MIDLQPWSEMHRDAFIAMHSDPVVMADQGGPPDRMSCGAKFNRYRDAWLVDGISRWAISGGGENFLGYAGVMRRDVSGHPLGPHHEIGWRFNRAAWGRGFATEAAKRALDHAWTVLEGGVIFAYTSPDNLRSQAVMTRLELRRDPARDFIMDTAQGDWQGLVWLAERPF